MVNSKTNTNMIPSSNTPINLSPKPSYNLHLQPTAEHFYDSFITEDGYRVPSGLAHRASLVAIPNQTVVRVSPRVDEQSNNRPTTPRGVFGIFDKLGMPTRTVSEMNNNSKVNNNNHNVTKNSGSGSQSLQLHQTQIKYQRKASPMVNVNNKALSSGQVTRPSLSVGPSRPSCSVGDQNKLITNHVRQTQGSFRMSTQSQTSSKNSQNNSSVLLGGNGVLDPRYSEFLSVNRESSHSQNPNTYLRQSQGSFRQSSMSQNHRDTSATSVNRILTSQVQQQQQEPRYTEFNSQGQNQNQQQQPSQSPGPGNSNEYLRQTQGSFKLSQNHTEIIDRGDPRYTELFAPNNTTTVRWSKCDPVYVSPSVSDGDSGKNRNFNDSNKNVIDGSGGNTDSRSRSTSFVTQHFQAIPSPDGCTRGILNISPERSAAEEKASSPQLSAKYSPNLSASDPPVEQSPNLPQQQQAPTVHQIDDGTQTSPMVYSNMGTQTSPQGLEEGGPTVPTVRKTCPGKLDYGEHDGIQIEIEMEQDIIEDQCTNMQVTDTVTENQNPNENVNSSVDPITNPNPTNNNVLNSQTQQQVQHQTLPEPSTQENLSTVQPPYNITSPLDVPTTMLPNMDAPHSRTITRIIKRTPQRVITNTGVITTQQAQNTVHQDNNDNNIQNLCDVQTSSPILPAQIQDKQITSTTTLLNQDQLIETSNVNNNVPENLSLHSNTQQASSNQYSNSAPRPNSRLSNAILSNNNSNRNTSNLNNLNYLKLHSPTQQYLAPLRVTSVMPSLSVYGQLGQMPGTGANEYNPQNFQPAVKPVISMNSRAKSCYNVNPKTLVDDQGRNRMFKSTLFRKSGQQPNFPMTDQKQAIMNMNRESHIVYPRSSSAQPNLETVPVVDDPEPVAENAEDHNDESTAQNINNMNENFNENQNQNRNTTTATASQIIPSGRQTASLSGRITGQAQSSVLLRHSNASHATQSTYFSVPSTRLPSSNQGRGSGRDSGPGNLSIRRVSSNLNLPGVSLPQMDLQFYAEPNNNEPASGSGHPCSLLFGIPGENDVVQKPTTSKSLVAVQEEETELNESQDQVGRETMQQGQDHRPSALQNQRWSSSQAIPTPLFDQEVPEGYLENLKGSPQRSMRGSPQRQQGSTKPSPERRASQISAKASPQRSFRGSPVPSQRSLKRSPQQSLRGSPQQSLRGSPTLHPQASRIYETDTQVVVINDDGSGGENEGEGAKGNVDNDKDDDDNESVLTPSIAASDNCNIEVEEEDEEDHYDIDNHDYMAYDRLSEHSTDTTNNINEEIQKSDETDEQRRLTEAARRASKINTSLRRGSISSMNLDELVLKQAEQDNTVVKDNDPVPLDPTFFSGFFPQPQNYPYEAGRGGSTVAITSNRQSSTTMNTSQQNQYNLSNNQQYVNPRPYNTLPPSYRSIEPAVSKTNKGSVTALPASALTSQHNSLIPPSPLQLPKQKVTASLPTPSISPRLMPVQSISASVIPPLQLQPTSSNAPTKLSSAKALIPPQALQPPQLKTPILSPRISSQNIAQLQQQQIVQVTVNQQLQSQNSQNSQQSDETDPLVRENRESALAMMQSLGQVEKTPVDEEMLTQQTEIILNVDGASGGTELPTQYQPQASDEVSDCTLTAEFGQGSESVIATTGLKLLPHPESQSQITSNQCYKQRSNTTGYTKDLINDSKLNPTTAVNNNDSTLIQQNESSDTITIAPITTKPDQAPKILNDKYYSNNLYVTRSSNFGTILKHKGIITRERSRPRPGLDKMVIAKNVGDVSIASESIDHGQNLVDDNAENEGGKGIGGNGAGPNGVTDLSKLKPPVEGQYDLQRRPPPEGQFEFQKHQNTSSNLLTRPPPEGQFEFSKMGNQTVTNTLLDGPQNPLAQIQRVPPVNLADDNYQMKANNINNTTDHTTTTTAAAVVNNFNNVLQDNRPVTRLISVPWSDESLDIDSQDTDDNENVIKKDKTNPTGGPSGPPIDFKTINNKRRETIFQKHTRSQTKTHKEICNFNDANNSGVNGLNTDSIPLAFRGSATIGFPEHCLVPPSSEGIGQQYQGQQTDDHNRSNSKSSIRSIRSVRSQRSQRSSNHNMDLNLLCPDQFAYLVEDRRGLKVTNNKSSKNSNSGQSRRDYANAARRTETMTKGVNNEKGLGVLRGDLFSGTSQKEQRKRKTVDNSEFYKAPEVQQQLKNSDNDGGKSKTNNDVKKGNNSTTKSSDVNCNSNSKSFKSYIKGVIPQDCNIDRLVVQDLDIGIDRLTSGQLPMQQFTPLRQMESPMVGSSSARNDIDNLERTNTVDKYGPEQYQQKMTPPQSATTRVITPTLETHRTADSNTSQVENDDVSNKFAAPPMTFQKNLDKACSTGTVKPARNTNSQIYVQQQDNDATKTFNKARHTTESSSSQTAKTSQINRLSVPTLPLHTLNTNSNINSNIPGPGPL